MQYYPSIFKLLKKFSCSTSPAAISVFIKSIISASSIKPSLSFKQSSRTPLIYLNAIQWSTNIGLFLISSSRINQIAFFFGLLLSPKRCNESYLFNQINTSPVLLKIYAKRFAFESICNQFKSNFDFWIVWQLIYNQIF